MRNYLFAALALCVAAAPAQAQSSQAYRCVYNSGGSYVSIKFGPGEVRYRSAAAGGDWGENICDDEMSDCGYKGHVFIAEGYDFFFTYNRDTTSFSFADYASQTRTLEGTCTPE